MIDRCKALRNSQLRRWGSRRWRELCSRRDLRRGDFLASFSKFRASGRGQDGGTWLGGRMCWNQARVVPTRIIAEPAKSRRSRRHVQGDGRVGAPWFMPAPHEPSSRPSATVLWPCRRKFGD